MSGRSVIVTGAGDSVGRVIAERFLARGDRVHIGDIRPEAVEATLAANPAMRGTVVDVAVGAEVDRLFADAGEHLEGLDYLVNVVGVGGPRALIEEIDMESWDATFAANVGGMLQCMQRAIPILKSRRSGAIVNFSTASTLTGLPSRTPYVASKYAVEGLTKNAARELGPFNISCNAILPGFIDNDRGRSVIAAVAADRGITVEQAIEESLQYTSMRTMIDPQELAAMVLHLCSTEGRNISGQMIAVDGHSEWEE